MAALRAGFTSSFAHFRRSSSTNASDHILVPVIFLIIFLLLFVFLVVFVVLLILLLHLLPPPTVTPSSNNYTRRSAPSSLGRTACLKLQIWFLRFGKYGPIFLVKIYLNPYSNIIIEFNCTYSLVNFFYQSCKYGFKILRICQIFFIIL